MQDSKCCVAAGEVQRRPEVALHMTFLQQVMDMHAVHGADAEALMLRIVAMPCRVQCLHLCVWADRLWQNPHHGRHACRGPDRPWHQLPCSGRPVRAKRSAARRGPPILLWQHRIAAAATATSGAEVTAASAMLAALPGLHREQQACLSEQGSVLHLVWQIEQRQDSFCIEPRQKAPMSHQILCGLMLIEQPQSKRLKTWQLMQAAWPV